MISSSLGPFFLKAVYENPYSDKKTWICSLDYKQIGQNRGNNGISEIRMVYGY
jgi:hypothetical protein